MANPRVLTSSQGATYDSMVKEFRWRIPEALNIGVVCSDAHRPTAPALIMVDRSGDSRTATFGDLSEMSNRFANGLSGLGVTRGDRVAIVVPQSLETGIAHLGIYKIGAVALPLAVLFGPDALAFRFRDSGARIVITTPENLEKVVEAVELAGTGAQIVVTGDGATGFARFDDLMQASPALSPASTAPEDPAFLIYTSGTTGQPKGALHAHRSLIGHLPGFEMYYESFPRSGDIHWTPADWAWIGGLMDSLIPSWYHGRPVVTSDHDFDPQWALDLITKQQITCSFLPPTALKMMRASGVSSDGLTLRAVFTGGEALGAEMLAWGEEVLGVTVNEGYGQTEANLVVGNQASVFPVRPGSMGRAVPGHDVRVLDDDGNPVVGTQGEIAVRGPDPVFMLEYWNRPDATRDKYDGDWLLTGDIGVEDEDGYLWFVSRKDDVINSRGYRIGPGEIEGSLMGHPAVAMCAVVGVPDEIRGQVPKAFVVLRPGEAPSDELAADLANHVRTRLAAHEVPREIVFIDDLPRTTTGKIRRRDLRES
jgi:acetyl-CoA synthetase